MEPHGIAIAVLDPAQVDAPVVARVALEVMALAVGEFQHPGVGAGPAQRELFVGGEVNLADVDARQGHGTQW